MTAPTRCIGVVALTAALFMPTVVFAQDTAPPIPVAEISGGYMLMRHSGDDSAKTFPGGWFFSGAANLNQWFGIVGEAGGSHKGENVDASGFRTENRLNLYTFMAGPRFFRQYGRVVPFAQVLTGVARSTWNGDYASGSFQGTFEGARNDFALQPGGGLTFYVSERVGARIGADYRYLADVSEEEVESAHEFRVIAGLTFGWGQR
jgi:hypothetical protein